MNKQAGLFKFIITLLIVFLILYFFHNQIFDFIRYLLNYKPKLT